jgi:hypothetical protein
VEGGEVYGEGEYVVGSDDGSDDGDGVYGYCYADGGVDGAGREGRDGEGDYAEGWDD